MPWRIVETDISTSVNGGEVVQAAVDRVAVYITNLGPAVGYLTNRPPNPAITTGFSVETNVSRILQWSKDGELARCVLYWIGPNNQSIHILEVLYYPEQEVT